MAVNCNSFSIRLDHGENEIPLYTADELLQRPENEIVRGTYRSRSEKHVTKALEKRFQGFLFGEESADGTRTNERLAVLGPHFAAIKKKQFGIDREFPTGVFNRKVSNATRLLPTEYVDILTINNRSNLSIIELKLDDIQPHVIAQILDYALFFSSYRTKLKEAVEERLQLATIDLSSIDAYVVNNRYHRLFDDALSYYKRSSQFPFSLWKITLGMTE